MLRGDCRADVTMALICFVLIRSLRVALYYMRYIYTSRAYPFSTTVNYQLFFRIIKRVHSSSKKNPYSTKSKALNDTHTYIYITITASFVKSSGLFKSAYRALVFFFFFFFDMRATTSNHVTSARPGKKIKVYGIDIAYILACSKAGHQLVKNRRCQRWPATKRPQQHAIML